MIKSNRLRLGIVFAIVALSGYLVGAKPEILQSILQTSLTTKAIVSSSLTVKAGDLKNLLKNKNFTLINVHTPYEGEIEKTDTFIAYNDLANNSALLPFDKTTLIILYCKTGRMSAEALVSLQKLGYTNVRHLDGGMDAWSKQGGKVMDLSKLDQQVIPESGAELPLSWNDLGPKLISLGVIDEQKLRQAVQITPEQEKILKGSDSKIKIDRTNVQFVVDMLWALGLAQKSLVYDEGPMGKEYKKDVGNFASTGGWTLASGSPMQSFNKYDLVPLTPDQQKQVAEISKNVYRACCGNSTYFPDCNHGMAALAMIELMVSKGLDEKVIYKKLLEFNSYWFPDTYLTTATYFARQGTLWSSVDPKQIMGVDFSSGKGAAEIAKKVGPLPWKAKSTTSCGA